MIEVKGLPKYIKSPEVKEILSNHINKVLRSCTVFVGEFSGVSTDKGLKKILKERKYKTIRKNLCPEYIKTDKERKDIILSLIRKIYDDEFKELTVDEKYVLSKICYEALSREENVISILAANDDMQLETWMWSRYMIEDTDERRKVLKHLKKMKIGIKEYPVIILEEKTVQERERILDVIGQTNMLVFEYPTVINLVFNPDEYEMLTGVQVKDDNEDTAR